MTFKQTLSGYPPEVAKLYEDVYQILKENPKAIISDQVEIPPFKGFETNTEFVKKCLLIADAVSFKQYLLEKKKEVRNGIITHLSFIKKKSKIKFKTL